MLIVNFTKNLYGKKAILVKFTKFTTKLSLKCNSAH